MALALAHPRTHAWRPRALQAAPVRRKSHPSVDAPGEGRNWWGRPNRGRASGAAPPIQPCAQYSHARSRVVGRGLEACFLPSSHPSFLPFVPRRATASASDRPCPLLLPLTQPMPTPSGPAQRHSSSSVRRPVKRRWFNPDAKSMPGHPAFARSGSAQAAAGSPNCIAHAYIQCSLRPVRLSLRSPLR